MFARSCLTLLSSLLLTGCLESFPPPPAIAAAPSLDPTVFFAGATHGDGHLDVRVGTDRSLRVEGSGSMQSDGRFRLDQTITRDDGDKSTRTWFMQRAAGDTFVATLTDATGEVHGEVQGTLFHIRYRIRQPAVYMEQWMYLQPDGVTVKNFAEISILGVPWARLNETIVHRSGPG